MEARDTLVGDGSPLNWALGLPIDEWTGIWINPDTRRVWVLGLYGRNLRGTIPGELSRLSGLVQLWLGANRLTGTIPPELGSLANLELADMGNNELTGTIPPELGNLQNLQDLTLWKNDLTGSIPPELGGLANLRRLFLSYTGLTGAIPPELGDATELTELWLQGNKLSGPIPPEIGNLEKMWTMLLNDNELTGSIPAELGRLSNLDGLKLSDNRLTGSIPGALTDLTKLTGLHLAGNLLTGCIPSVLHDVEQNDLHRLGLPDCPPVAVIDLVMGSTPRDGRAYGIGESIRVSVWFGEGVTVVGAPLLALAIGTDDLTAGFDANRGDGELAFRYTVGVEDYDADGISIAADALSLNGGLIKHANGVVLDIGEHAIKNDPSHKVRGALRDPVSDQELPTDGETLTLDLSRHFDIPADSTLAYAVPFTSDPNVVAVSIENGMLRIVPLEHGTATVTVTATDANGASVAVNFEVTVTASLRFPRPWLLGILSTDHDGEGGADGES